MGNCFAGYPDSHSMNQSCVASEAETIHVDNFNVHTVHPDLKIHTVITNELDFNHQQALEIPLGEVTDEQLIAEIVERSLEPESASGLTVDPDSHLKSMKIPLEAVTDQELLTELARRKLDIHESVNESLVNETYEMGRVIGHGASGKVYKCKHKQSKVDYACKGNVMSVGSDGGMCVVNCVFVCVCVCVCCAVIQKDSRMNDAQSMSTEVEIMKRLQHENVVGMYEVSTHHRQS
jgi:hypothetical protein